MQRLVRQARPLMRRSLSLPAVSRAEVIARTRPNEVGRSKYHLCGRCNQSGPLALTAGGDDRMTLDRQLHES